MDILSILRMIYHCVHPLTLATSHQYKPFVPSKFSRKNPETLSRRGMLLALAARASAYPKSRKIGLMDTAESPATQHKSSSLDHRWSTLGDFLNIFWNPRTQTAIQCQYISKPWNFPIFFWVPKPFLDDMRKGMTTRHLCCNVIHPAVRPTCCKSCSACWGDPAGFLGQQPAETMLVTQ